MGVEVFLGLFLVFVNSSSTGAERTKMSPPSSNLAHSEDQNCPIYFLRLTQRANEIIYHVYKSILKRKIK